MTPTFSYLAENIGLIGAIAVALNLVLLAALIKLASIVGRKVVAEIKEIKDLLAEETKSIRDRLTTHGERIARLEARDHRRDD